MTASLPFSARHRHWKLKSVCAQSESLEQTTRGHFKNAVWLEVKLPELMKETHMFYSLNNEPETPEPERALRFFFESSISTPIFPLEGTTPGPDDGDAYYKSVNAYPNLDMGHHELDAMELNLEVTVRSVVKHAGGVNDDVIFFPIIQYEIILEYE